MEQSHNIQFKAGQMKIDAETKKVTSDRRMGLVEVFKDNDQNTHITWQDAKTKQEELHLYIFPGDSKFELSKQAKRVLILKLESDSYFFWLQEPDQSQDIELCTKLNQLINMQVEQYEYDEQMQEEGEEDEEESSSQIPPTQATQAQIMGQEFQKALQQLQQFGSVPQQQQRQQRQKESPYLTDLFDTNLIDFIKNDEECVNSLLEFLPDDQKSKEYLNENLRSPQLQQALESLDRALNSEDILSVIMSMGFDQKALQDAQDGNDALYKALKLWADKNKQ